MLKTISIRIEKELYDKIKKSDINTTNIIRTALKEYFEKNTENNTYYQSNTDEKIYKEYTKHLIQQIEDINNDKKYLQQRLDYFITLKTPFINRLFKKSKLLTTSNI